MRYLFFVMVLANAYYGFSQPFTEADIGAYTIEPGTYRILDYPINIRDQPTINGNVIGKLQLHDEIEVIENMGNPQVIGGVLQNWYKIKSSDREGYIWGGFIATEVLIADVDGNGINDYFYSRIREIIRIYNPNYTGNPDINNPMDMSGVEY